MAVNRFGELEVFVRVVEAGGFSSAARLSGLTPSAVSKLVTRLEQRLGTRLLNRSTRQLQLTAEGCAFYERGVRLLADLEDAERCGSAGSTPRGRLRINANVPFGHHVLLPLLPDFLARYPEVTLDLVLTDEVVDLLEQRTDVAIRAGRLKDSQLVARRLGATPMLIVGAPHYLARQGTPLTPDDLLGHNRLGANYARAQPGWPLRQGAELLTLPLSGTVQASDGEALRHLALAGVGLARLAAFQVTEDLAAGRLQAVLQDCNPGDREEIHAVYLGQGGAMPQRIRVFLDFLAERVVLAEPR